MRYIPSQEIAGKR